MARNRSEKGPRIMSEKMVTPLDWEEPTQVRITCMVDGTHSVSVEATDDPSTTWVEAKLTLNEAAGLYVRLSNGFYFPDLNPAMFAGVTNWEGRSAT